VRDLDGRRTHMMTLIHDSTEVEARIAPASTLLATWGRRDVPSRNAGTFAGAPER
jgi:hypothetical protein